MRKPLDVLVEHVGNAQLIARDCARFPEWWARPRLPGQTSFVEAFTTIDGAAPGIQTIIDRADASLAGTNGTLTGIAAVDRDFLHALFGSFPYALAIVPLLTLVLLTRASRSVVLALKAVLLNLLSLAAAFGIVVFIFQQGHGASLWGLTATQSITAYIPVMVFAFLFGLSMDYEVFMLSRMREAYDEMGSTDKAIELGLARTGKLVTSAALILMFALPRALIHARLRDQVARDRPRRGDHLRRHRDPRPARSGAHATPRRRQLVDARMDAHRASPARTASQSGGGGRAGVGAASTVRRRTGRPPGYWKRAGNCAMSPLASVSAIIRISARTSS